MAGIRWMLVVLYIENTVTRLQGWECCRMLKPAMEFNVVITKKCIRSLATREHRCEYKLISLIEDRASIFHSFRPLS